MKKSVLYFLLIGSFALFIHSCSKNEQAAVKNNPEKLVSVKLGVPLDDGRTAVDLKPRTNATTVNGQSNPVTVLWKNAIEIPDNEYLKSTCLLDISTLNNYGIYDSIADKGLQLNFGTEMRKLDGYPKGWTALWNIKPYVELETPPVLYSIKKNTITIILSKPCTIFGFELAPNLYDSFEFTAGFYSTQYNPPLARVTQTVTTPLGARLFAVKTEKPFDVIEIQFTGPVDSDYQPYGFAITNLRYKLSK